jgi:sugar/nucleoside kinase (ribokinase family)
MATPPYGLFVGLTTLDLIYRATSPPTANQKLVALDYTLAAGGPATNAAVAFAYAGGCPTLLTALGQHPITQLIQSDLANCQVKIADLAPTRVDPPPVSSIIVTAATGDRAVIGINAVNHNVPAAAIPAACHQALDQRTVAIVLIDGHQIEVSRAIAKLAKAKAIPTVLDGGSWKPGLETLLPHIDYAICSANFHPPEAASSLVNRYLAEFGIAHIAITQGDQPIQYWSPTHSGVMPVPSIHPLDTLGAGDIFHGAFCHAILHQDFPTALATAAHTASRSCQSFGTRQWMD